MTDYYRKVIREQVDTVATPARWRVELDCGHSAPWFDGDHVPVQCRVGENVWCDECLFVASSAKRVWKENWQDDEGQVNPFGTREIKQPMVVCMYGALDERAARSRLIAAAPAMVRLLLRLEWHAGNDCGDSDCAAGLEHGHWPGCRWDEALTKAGFPDQASRDAARKEMGI